MAHPGYGSGQWQYRKRGDNNNNNERFGRNNNARSSVRDHSHRARGIGPPGRGRRYRGRGRRRPQFSPPPTSNIGTVTRTDKDSTNKYKATFSWKITNPLDVSKFLKAKPRQMFASSIFKIGGIEWQLYAYPEGKYPPNRDNETDVIKGCELHLHSISASWPNNVHSIVFNYRLFCLNASSSFTNIEQFIRNQNRYVSWFRGTLTTNELEALEGQIVHLQCYINILKVIDIRDRRSIIYQFPYKNIKTNCEFEWKIDNIDALFINTKCGKHMESDIFDNCWCLRIAPKGWKLEEQRFVCLWLQLCCLPMNISRVRVRFDLKCIETNNNHSATKIFSYSPHDTNVGWNKKVKLLTNGLKAHKSLTFQCKIKILQKYDLAGYEVALVDDRKVNDEVLTDDMKRLKQEIATLKSKVAAIEFKTGMDHTYDEEVGDWGRNLSVIEMLKELKQDIELLKRGNYNKGIVNAVDPVQQWLQNIVQLPEYHGLFIENGLEDLGVIKMLNVEELKAIGIQKLGHQKKIMSEINKLNQARAFMDGDGANENMNEGQYYPSPGDSNFI